MAGIIDRELSKIIIHSWKNATFLQSRDNLVIESISIACAILNYIITCTVMANIILKVQYSYIFLG
jgi:hypothetical protein